MKYEADVQRRLEKREREGEGVRDGKNNEALSVLSVFISSRFYVDLALDLKNAPLTPQPSLGLTNDRRRYLMRGCERVAFSRCMLEEDRQTRGGDWG
jgi:hypothetical protein